MIYRLFLKRVLDLFLSFLLLLLLSPIFIIISVLTVIFMGFPIFFKQERTTKNGSVFKIIKFRTMKNTKDENGNLLPNEMRKTKFGSMLRSSSLDELPELFNIFLGNMSFVGPRPLPQKYDDYYYDCEKIRFEVRGGLIPPDSVDINPIISWDEQFKYDIDYAKNISFIKDCKIVFLTFRVLLKRRKDNYGGVFREPLDLERKKDA